MNTTKMVLTAARVVCQRMDSKIVLHNTAEGHMYVEADQFEDPPVDGTIVLRAYNGGDELPLTKWQKAEKIPNTPF